MSGNNFAQPSWATELLEANQRGPALPQYTDAEYHAADSTMSVKALVRLVERSQNEYCRLRGIIIRLNQTNECLKAGTYTDEKRQAFAEQEEDGFAEYLNSYDEEIYKLKNWTKELALDGLRGQHQIIVEEREKIVEAEEEMARLQKEAAGKASSGSGKGGEGSKS